MKNISFLTLNLSTSLSGNHTLVDTVQNFYKALDAGDLSELEKTLSKECQVVNPFAPHPFPLEAFIGMCQGFKTAFPNMRHEVQRMVADGHNIAVRGTFRGKNDGPMNGMPATGNQVASPFGSFFEIDQAGKITSIHITLDVKSFEAQLMGA